MTAHWTAVLERIAGVEEAEALRLLEDHPAFRATLEAAINRWDVGTFRVDDVLQLSQIVQEHAPDLVWLYGPYLHLYLGCMVQVAALVLQGKVAEAEETILMWRPYPIHLSVGNPLIVKRMPDGSFTLHNPNATAKREHWDQWRGFLRALRPEGKGGRPEGAKDQGPRQQPHSIEAGMAGEAYAALAGGATQEDVIRSLWPKLDYTGTYARKKLRKLIRHIVAERGNPQD